MKNSNLITTVILAQAALIFIGFKIPDKAVKNSKTSEEKLKKEVLSDVEPINNLLEKNTKGELNGVSYNLVYPFLEEQEGDLHIPFNDKISYKINKLGSQFGFGNELSELCNESSKVRSITKQYLDYKLYNHNDSVLSLLLMKGDYFDDEVIPKFSFKALNYDINKGKFLEFEDLFYVDSKSSFVELANSYSKLPLLTSNCQAIHLDDFEYYKNNFVLGDSSVKFYFDDCIMCYEENGEYAIEIPIEHIKPLMVNPNIIKGLTSIIK